MNVHNEFKEQYGIFITVMSIYILVANDFLLDLKQCSHSFLVLNAQRKGESSPKIDSDHILTQSSPKIDSDHILT